MTILAQHGWGRGSKIEEGISMGSIGGVIMSPRDELPANLETFLSSLSSVNPSTERLVDPQLYAGTVHPERHGKLDNYPHYRNWLDPMSFSPAETRRIVGAVLDWQRTLDVTSIISPTVLVDDLHGQWGHIAMTLAQETLLQHDGSKPLLISLFVAEDALRQRMPVNAWLDNLTRLEADGFYLVVVRHPSVSYSQRCEPEILKSLLSICYSLAEINQYRVFVGYTDFAALLLHAVGVTATATGWHFGLRQFSQRRFQDVGGGRQPRPRYSSTPLLNSIYMSELDGIHDLGRINDVLTGTILDNRFSVPTNPENVPWPANVAALHHWEAVARGAQSVTAASVGDRLNQAENAIAQAQALYAQIAGLVPFSAETGPTHLAQWLDALNRFRSEAAV